MNAFESSIDQPALPNRPWRHSLLGTSREMTLLRGEIAAAAASNATVLLTGETGCGKEVVAREIHRHSLRKQAPFVTINCAGVPDTLLESEFFGHTRGSFTGAERDSPGMLRQAHRGTVLLDEVGEMSLRMQALLLRFLETGEIQTVGGSAAHPVIDVRIVAATNRNLAESAAAHEFRQDLYYRLNVLHIRIAPLRERHGDIPILLDHYRSLFCHHHHKPPLELSRETLDVLTAYSWPGNIRELRNVVERMVVRAGGSVIEPSHLSPEILRSVEDARHQPAAPDHPVVSHRQRVEAIIDRMLHKGESFWTTAYPAFMARDITRDDMRVIVSTGLSATRGSYRVMLDVFHMVPGDYKRFLSFLKQHDCHEPFQRFRTAKAVPTAIDRTPRRRSEAS